jgi:hypothetical protein
MIFVIAETNQILKNQRDTFPPRKGLLADTRPYMWYVECLLKTYNAVDRTFYDAIMDEVS